MPTRIPIYRDDIYKRLDEDKAEIIANLKKEMNDLALLILAKLEQPKVNIEQPKVSIQPMKKKK